MPETTTEANVSPDFDGLKSLVTSLFNDGYILRDYTPISQAEMESVYGVAYRLFNQRQYAKAERIFTILCQLDHYDGRFWLALGACRQMQNNYSGALNAYSLAGIHDVENPVPPLRAAECFLAMNRIDDAENGVTAAIHWAADRPEYGQLKARAELMLENIRRKKVGQP